MGFIKSISPPKKEVKHPSFGRGDEVMYSMGASKPTAVREITAYQNSVERLDTAIRTLSDLASKAKPEYFRVDGKGNLKKQNIKELDSLFINDTQSYIDFNKMIFATLLRYNSLLIVPEQSKSKLRAGKVDFFTLDNNKWYLEAGQTGSETISRFVYKTSMGQDLVYNYSDVIYMANAYDISNPLYGIPRITSLNRLLQMELSGTAFSENYMAQGGKKSLFVNSNEWLAPEARVKLTEQLRSYLDTTEAKIILMDAENVKVTPTSDGLSSAQIIEMLTFINNSILASFRLPPSLLGSSDRAQSEGELKIQARVCYEINISPILLSLEAHFTRYIQQTLGLKNIIMKFNTDDISIFEESYAETVEIVKAIFQLGLFSPNEARVELGKERVEHPNYDKRYPPAYITGVGAIAYEDLDTTSLTPSLNIPNGEGGTANTPNMGGVE